MADAQDTPAATGQAKIDEPDADDVRARAVAAQEEVDAIAPTPTQDELDRMKRGESLEATKSGAYKTRQTKAG